MKLNKYALVLFLGLGTLTSCNDNLELLNPNQQTSNTFGFNADDLEERCYHTLPYCNVLT